MRLTRVRVDEGVDMDAGAGASSIKHHSVEDAAVVGWPTQAGENPLDATHQIQQRVAQLGPAVPGQQGQEDQEETTQPGGEYHRRSCGGSALTE